MQAQRGRSLAVIDNGVAGLIPTMLRPRGRGASRAITTPRGRMPVTRDTHTRIRKYILPGGLLSPAAAVVDAASLRPHYAGTLRLCRECFPQRRNRLVRLRFDEVFETIWELYPAYSEAELRSDHRDVCRWTFGRKGPW